MGCVYRATCLVNRKRYIGKTKHSLSVRKRGHEIDALSGSKMIFHKALRKYGFENFLWEIVFESVSEKILISVEIETIIEESTLIPDGYNACEGGYGPNGYTHTLETRAKMSAIRSGKPLSEGHKKSLSIARRARVLSETERRRLVELNVSRKGVPLTPERRKQVSESLLGHKKSEYTKMRMREAWKKRRLVPLTEEQRTRYSMMGKKGKGRKKSPEHVRKVIESRTRNRMLREQNATE